MSCFGMLELKSSGIAIQIPIACNNRSIIRHLLFELRGGDVRAFEASI